MKKNLLILVMLIAFIVIPGKVSAATLKVVTTDGTHLKCETEKDEKLQKKITTCDVILEVNGGDFNGGVVDLTFEPERSTTTFDFQVDTAFAKEESHDKNVYKVNVEPIKDGKTAVVGVVKWQANLTEEKCGGTVKPSWKGTENNQSASNDPTVTDTGYAIPYLALGAGLVGVVTVIASSKKKTKMYKI